MELHKKALYYKELGETDDWYRVIMYNNEEAYIQKKYVRTTKLFMAFTAA